MRHILTWLCAILIATPAWAGAPPIPPSPPAIAANPTATSATAAVNGTATTFMRSDAAPALGTTTGTGSIVRSASPTFTGTLSAAAATLSSTLTTNVTGSTQCLQANSSGVVSGTGAGCGGSGGLTVGTTTITSGTTGRLEYNNAGVLGETTAITTNGSGDITSTGTYTANSIVSNGNLWGAQLVGGGAVAYETWPAAATFQLGQADAATAVAQTLQAQSVVAGTSNTAGANLTLKGSRGTGTGAGGAILLQTAAAGTTGTSQNAATTAAQVNPDQTFQYRKAFTVSTLPTCNAGEQGATGFVTDASAPTYLGTLTGSSSTVTPVFCNGSAWVSY